MVYLVMALALPRSARWAGSGQLVPVTHIKIVRPGIHLVFEDAVWDSSRCEADDEHAPTGNLDPDGMRPLHSAAHPGTWDDVSVFYCLVYTAEDDLE